MYSSYFHFAEYPFENNLDSRFLFVSEDHKEVLAALSYFIKTKKAFAIVCGDVGTGKTMLINSFLGTLEKDVQPIIVANPGVTSLELLRYIAKKLKIEVREQDGILDLTDAIKELLQRARSLNKQFVLIIDEAHLLTNQALEEIRLLSNIENQEQKLLQILLVGQYELSDKLDQPEMRHLRQRININRFLSPMNSDETVKYVEHRLRQVGSSFAAIFADNCASAIYKMTGGVPRNINQLCDNALLICMGERRQKVNKKILRKAQEALQTDRIFTPKAVNRIRGSRLRLPRLLFWTVIFTACLALGIGLNQVNFSGKAAQTQGRAATPLNGSFQPPEASPANPSRAIKNSLPMNEGLTLSAKTHAPGKETSLQPTISPAGPKSVLPQVPAPGKLIAPTQTTIKASAVGESKDLASIGAEPGRRDFPERALASGLSILPELKPPRAEAAGLPGTVKEAKAPAPSVDSPQPGTRRREVKQGETLSIIASQVYHGSEELGVEALLLDNPEIKNRDLIYPGQVICLPWIMADSRIIQLRDNLFYSLYGRYDSTGAQEKVAALLEQRGVHYTTFPRVTQGRKTSLRLLLGGYQTIAELKIGLELARLNN